jgi:spore coat polysaccharide biosynthesis protein SpsF
MILAILQARMSSRRLPGKVLCPVGGAPMIYRQIERIRRAGCIDRIVVATSDQPDDDAIVAACAAIGVACRRGPLDDVLERFRLAAAPDAPRQVVRLTADCPLIDWKVVDRLVGMHVADGYQYSTNALQRTYPHGLDCEIMTFEALNTAAADAVSAHDREHVTPYLYREGSELRIGHLTQSEDRSFLRWTVDTPEDLALVDAVYQELYPANSAFTTSDVIDLFARRPELRFINAAHQSAGDRAKAEAFWRAYDGDGLTRRRA